MLASSSDFTYAAIAELLSPVFFHLDSNIPAALIESPAFATSATDYWTNAASDKSAISDGTPQLLLRQYNVINS